MLNNIKTMQSNKIIIRGARQHNLKNINVELPRNKLIVITGLSGSGKSTLAFDTLYAGMYMDKYGKYLSKALVHEKSVYSGTTTLLIYKGKFEKNDNVQISINLIKEGNSFKVMQVRFDG